MATTEHKTRTVTLTGRSPVKIVERDWPTIASASGDSFGASDYCRRQQALARGEVDTYSIRVRRHADNRTLVYGVLDAAIAEWHQPAAGHSKRGGYLIPTYETARVVAAIDQVAQELGLLDLASACIADLPAEEI